jgi:probable addiction module antidote protein
MNRKTRPYREARLERLGNPAVAKEYLKLAMEESQESFLKALGNVAQARQMTKVAKEAGLQRETLYRSFSEQGNPTLGTLSSVLKAVGLKLTIEEDSPLPIENELKLPLEMSQETKSINALIAQQPVQIKSFDDEWALWTHVGHYAYTAATTGHAVNIATQEMIGPLKVPIPKYQVSIADFDWSHR